MNETLTESDGRYVLSMERWFPHPVEKVWRAITEPEELRHWFPSTVVVDPRVGGAMRFVFEGGEGPPMDGVVLALEPPRRCSYTWGDAILSFELRPESTAAGPGCRLLFSHTFDDRVSAASFGAGWDICFQNLALTLGGKPADVGLDQWAAAHDELVERFGLDQGTISQQPDGSRVIRFARQLTKPVDVVWATITGGHDPVAGAPVPPGFTTCWRVDGAFVTVEPPTVLEYIAGNSRVRYSLSPGNGGAVVELTETTTAAASDAGGDVMAVWADRLADLAKTLRDPGRAA